MKTLKTLIAATAFALSGAANADTWDFVYSGDGITGSGTFSSGSVSTPYALTGITGMANGSTITGLSSYAGADNLLFYPANPGPQYTTFGGISFSTDGGPDWNLFWNGGNFSIRSDFDSIGYGSSGVAINLLVTASTEVSVTAVPEPETYAMLIAGLGLLGFAARRRKLKEATAA